MGGPHIVSIRKPGKAVRHYVYAWRDGPNIHTQIGGPKPKITGALIDAIAKARASHGHSESSGTISGLIVAYKDSADFRRLKGSSQTNYRYYLDLIEKRFGKAKIAVFNDKRIRGDILEWRDQWADKPRTADEVIKVLRRLLYWAIERGHLDRNPAANVKQLYNVNRAKHVWTEEHIAAFNAVASPTLREAMELAAYTGLRRGDLVEVTWNAVGEHAIIRPTNKSNGKKEAVIPLLKETRELLDRIKARHAEEMSQLPPDKRRDLPATILSTEAWRPWSAGSLSQAFQRAKKAADISVRLHDLRGTFATRCMLAGLNDQQIADILGWDTDDIRSIRSRYVDQKAIMLAIAERLSGDL